MGDGTGDGERVGEDANGRDRDVDPGRDSDRDLADQDALARAAADEARRERLARTDPEPSLGARLGQIGLLGWMIVTPTLLATWAGRRLDAALASGVTFSAALLMLGAAFGLWLAWRWMHSR